MLYLIDNVISVTNYWPNQMEKVIGVVKIFLLTLLSSDINGNAISSNTKVCVNLFKYNKVFLVYLRLILL